MEIAAIVGLTGTLIDLVRATPQLARLVRTRQAFGVSVDTAATSCIVSSGWTVYGIITQQPFVMLASGFMATIFLMITLMALRLGRSPREIRVAPIWLAVLLVAGIGLGKNGLGAALAVSSLASNIPQIRVAYREDNLSGLSLGSWLLTLSGGLVWGFYGVLKGDMAIMASAFFQSLTSLIIIGLKVTKRGGGEVTETELALD